MKRCYRCDTTKPASEFHRNIRSRDGLQASCKPCQLAINREYARRRGVPERQPRHNRITRCGSFAVLHLTHGKAGLIDLADLDRVTAHYWVAEWDGCNWYVKNFYRGDQGKGRSRFLHRFLLGLAPYRPLVDHINGNTLDNRRANLRTATSNQNAQNRRRAVTNSTGFKGVTFEDGRYRARIRVDGRKVSLGSFPTAEQAAAAYDAAARDVFGEFARCNVKEVVL